MKDYKQEYNIICEDIANNIPKFYETLKSLFKDKDILVDDCFYNEYYTGEFKKFSVVDFAIFENNIVSKTSDVIGNVKALDLKKPESERIEKYYSVYLAYKKEDKHFLFFLTNIYCDDYDEYCLVHDEDGLYEIRGFDKEDGEYNYFGPKLKIKFA